MYFMTLEAQIEFLYPLNHFFSYVDNDIVKKIMIILTIIIVIIVKIMSPYLI